MSEPIRHNEIIEIDKTLAGIAQIIAELKNMQATMRQTASEVVTFQQKQDPGTKSGKAGTQQASAQTQKLTKEYKQLAIAEQNATKETIRLKAARKALLAEQRRQIQVLDAEKGSLDRNRVALQKLIERYGKAGPAAAKKMETRINSLTGKIKRQEEATGRHQRSVGRYQKVFANAKAALASFAVGMVGATAIMGLMSRGIKKIIGITEDFEQGMANVKAITNASKKEFTALSVSAIDLGRVTKFTATQVAELQFEYAKLGFSTREIIAASRATLDLAAATGTDLARAAEVAGGVIRAFGLNASEAQRVADVMAQSFATSALDMEKFAESMKYVAPVAKISNVSLERTTAILGVLANNMIQGSKAGTALRMILGKTGKTAEGFEERLRTLAEEGLNLADAQDEVGQRAYAALLVMVDQYDLIEKLETAYNNVEGATARMAEIMLDTAKGQKTIVKSAMEGLVLTAQNSTEAMEGYKGALGGLAKALNWVSDNFTVLSKVASWTNRTLAMLAVGPLPLLQKIFKGLRDDTLEFSQSEADAAAETERLANEELARIKTENDLRAKAYAEQLERIEAEEKAELKKIAAIKKAQEEYYKSLSQMRALESSMAEEEYNRVMKGIEDELAISSKKAAQDKKDGDDFQAMLKAQAAVKTEATLAELAADAAAKEEQKSADDKAAADRKAGMEATMYETAGVLFALTDLKMAKLDQEKAHEIEAAHGNKAKIAAIEKKYAKEQQKVAVTQALIDSSLAIVKTLSSVVFPFNIIAAALVAAQAGIQVAAIRSQTFEKGGHGELGGERHSQGGTYLPGIGEAEKGEYFGIINRQMTRKYSHDLPAIFDSLNSGRFHDVWSNANIQLQENIDPWTKRMYDLMAKTPTTYTDSNGDTVREYPDGYVRVIRKVS